MGFLASIGTWILKLLLGGLFGKFQNQEAEKARTEASAAKVAVETGDEAHKLEDKLRADQETAKKDFETRDKLKDPFGIKSFNDAT